MQQKIIYIIVFYFVLTNLYSQSDSLKEDHTYKPFILDLDESGEKYIRFLTLIQIWGTYIEPNASYVDFEGNQIENTYDIGIRRARLIALGQVSPRFSFLFHFGINNQQFSGGGAPVSGAKKPQLFVHDLWTEYRLIDENLYIGAGLHIWNGISRITSGSTLNMMTLDAPIFNWPTIELTDQFGRQLGIYAKGKLGKIDYRLAFNKPFAFGTEPLADSLNSVSQYVRNENFAYAGYAEYEFLDQESNKLPYRVGTYLGKKNIFNLGAGFYYHPETMGTSENGNVVLHNQLFYAFDLFWEHPLPNNQGISLYAGFFNYDFGPNYLREVGIMSSSGLFGNGSNNQPMMGTGNVFYTQLGFLLPEFNDGQHLMPYTTFTFKNFHALDGPTDQFDFGINYFINGHFSKISLQYSARPRIVDNKQDGHLGKVILQTHIFL